MKDKLRVLWRFIYLVPTLLGITILLFLFGDPQEDDN